MSREYRDLPTPEERAARKSQAEEFAENVLYPAFESYRRLVGYPRSRELAALNELLFQRYKTTVEGLLFDRSDAKMASMGLSKEKPTSDYYEFFSGVERWRGTHRQAEKGNTGLNSIIANDIELRNLEEKIAELREKAEELKRLIAENKKKGKKEIEDARRQLESRLLENGVRPDDFLVASMPAEK